MAEQDKNVNQTPAQGKTDKPAKKKDAWQDLQQVMAKLRELDA